MSKIFKNKTGLSLIELTIAMAIINVGLLGVWTLFLSNFIGERETEMRIVGANLAREGIEAVKNIRDSNWLDIENGSFINWHQNIGIDKDLIVTNLFNDGNQMIALVEVPNINDQLARVYLHKNNHYYFQDSTYDSSIADITAYKRVIHLNYICCTPRSDAIVVCDSAKQLHECAEGSTDLKIGLKVKSLVKWDVDGRARQIDLQDEIYDWK